MKLGDAVKPLALRPKPPRGWYTSGAGCAACSGRCWWSWPSHGPAAADEPRRAAQGPAYELRLPPVRGRARRETRGLRRRCLPPNPPSPCIFGSGGGLAIRVGYRSRGPWYVGGAYESSRQDPSNLMRLAILQQLRAESRYYFDRAIASRPTRTRGSASSSTATSGARIPAASPPFWAQVSSFSSAAPRWSAQGWPTGRILLRGWTDSAGQRRADRYLGFGLAHVVALEVVVEVRDPLPRW